MRKALTRHCGCAQSSQLPLDAFPFELCECTTLADFYRRYCHILFPLLVRRVCAAAALLCCAHTAMVARVRTCMRRRCWSAIPAPSRT